MLHDNRLFDPWRDPMTVEQAKEVLGERHFEWVVSQGAADCARRAACAWNSNVPSSYAAYRAAERHCNERAAGRA